MKSHYCDGIGSIRNWGGGRTHRGKQNYLHHVLFSNRKPQTADPKAGSARLAGQRRIGLVQSLYDQRRITPVEAVAPSGDSGDQCGARSQGSWHTRIEPPSK